MAGGGYDRRLDGADKMSGREDDLIWLDFRRIDDDKPLALPYEEEDFVERVAIKVDSNISERDAREQAYQEIFCAGVAGI